MPSINFFYSRRFVNAKRETAKRFSLLKNDCFCKTELIIAGFVSLCKTFFNFYSHRFAVSAHIQPFFRCFSHFERLIIHFMGSSAPFSSEGLTFCMIMQDFVFDSILRACENALSTRFVKNRAVKLTKHFKKQISKHFWIWGFAPSPHQRAFRSPFGNLRA